MTNTQPPVTGNGKKRKSKILLHLFLLLFVTVLLIGVALVSQNLTGSVSQKEIVHVKKSEIGENLYLERKDENRTKQVATFPIYTTGTSTIQRWKNLIFFTQVRSSLDPTIPSEVDLYEHELDRGLTHRIYSTDEFDFSQGGKLTDEHIYYTSNYRRISFLVYEDTLFFSVLSEGIDGSNPGPGASFFVTLPDISKIQRFYPEGGTFVKNDTSYWLYSYYSPMAESYPMEIFRLFDPETRAVVEVAREGYECGESVRSKFLGKTKRGELLFEECQKASEPFFRKVSAIHVYDIKLKKDTKVIPVPSDVWTTSFDADGDQIVMSGGKNIYSYSFTTDSQTTLTKLNDWSGDKMMMKDIPLYSFGNEEPVGDASPEVSFADSQTLCFVYGSALGGPGPLYALYSISTQSLRKVEKLPESCMKSEQLFQERIPKQQKEDISFEYLNLPSDYSFRIGP